MQTMIDLSVMMSEPAAENWIQIMKTGKWDHPQLGKIQITPADLHKFKENFDNQVRGTDLSVDVSHNPDAGAVAWFKELKVDGDKLMAKVAWTDEGANLIKSGKYRYFSPEFKFVYKDAESGKSFKDVLFGGAITNRPFLKQMEPIAFSEGGMAHVWMAENEDYDPDHDGDDDTTTNPKDNPDWMLDVLAGITPWPSDEAQQKKLKEVGATKQACEAAFKMRQKQLGKDGDPKAQMSDNEPSNKMGDGVTNAHKSPPKGDPQSKSDYADPDHYKYPIDDKKHVHAALGYFNHDGEREKGGYSKEQWAKIGHRIAEAANKIIGPGHKYENGKIETKSVKANDPNMLENWQKTSPTHPTDNRDAGKYSETNGGGNQMTDQVINMEEYNAMKEQVARLKEENRRAEFKEKVQGFTFNESTKSGKIFPAQEEKILDLMMNMSDEQVAKFEEVLNEMPDAIKFNDEKGVGYPGQRKSRDVMVEEKAEALMKENKNMDYRQAIIMAEEEIPETIK